MSQLRSASESCLSPRAAAANHTHVIGASLALRSVGRIAVHGKSVQLAAPSSISGSVDACREITRGDMATVRKADSALFTKIPRRFLLSAKQQAAYAVRRHTPPSSAKSPTECLHSYEAFSTTLPQQHGSRGRSEHAASVAATAAERCYLATTVAVRSKSAPPELTAQFTSVSPSRKRGGRAKKSPAAFGLGMATRQVYTDAAHLAYPDTFSPSPRSPNRQEGHSRAHVSRVSSPPQKTNLTSATLRDGQQLKLEAKNEGAKTYIYRRPSHYTKAAAAAATANSHHVAAAASDTDSDEEAFRTMKKQRSSAFGSSRGRWDTTNADAFARRQSVALRLEEAHQRQMTLQAPYRRSFSVPKSIAMQNGGGNGGSALVDSMGSSSSWQATSFASTETVAAARRPSTAHVAFGRTLPSAEYEQRNSPQRSPRRSATCPSADGAQLASGNALTLPDAQCSPGSFGNASVATVPKTASPATSPRKRLSTSFSKRKHSVTFTNESRTIPRASDIDSDVSEEDHTELLKQARESGASRTRLAPTART